MDLLVSASESEFSTSQKQVNSTDDECHLARWKFTEKVRPLL